MALTLRFLHVFAALVWIGGMLFIALVLVPVARGLNDPALRARLFHAAGVRFRAVGWIALGRLRARASWLGRVNTALVLVVVLLGLSLRG